MNINYIYTCIIYILFFIIYGWIRIGKYWNIHSDVNGVKSFKTFTNGLSFQYKSEINLEPFIHHVVVVMVGVGLIIQYMSRRKYMIHVGIGLLMYNIVNVLYIQGIILQSKTVFSVKSIISYAHGVVGLILNSYGLYEVIVYKRSTYHKLSFRYICYQFMTAASLNPFIWYMSTYYGDYINIFYDVAFVILLPLSIWYLKKEYEDIVKKE